LQKPASSLRGRTKKGTVFTGSEAGRDNGRQVYVNYCVTALVITGIGANEAPREPRKKPKGAHDLMDAGFGGYLAVHKALFLEGGGERRGVPGGKKGCDKPTQRKKMARQWESGVTWDETSQKNVAYVY